MTAVGDERKTERLFEWQHKLIDDITEGPNKYGVFEKSRRVGGTFSFGIAAVEYCLKTGHNCWFSSSDEKNAREFLLYVRSYCEVYNAVLGFKWIDIEAATTETMLLPNGNRISGLSSNPRALRGKDGLIILDEVALHEQQEDLLRAAQGCVIQRGKLWLLSTHNGPATLFYQLAREAEAGKKDWSHHCVTLVDAVAQGYARKFAPGKTDEEFIESVRRSCLSEEAFGQEFMCKPLSLAALIAAEQYDALALWDVPEQLDPSVSYRPLYVGIDVGRTHDLTVLWAVEQYENTAAISEYERHDFKTVCVRAIRNADFPTQAQMLRPILAHSKVTRVLIDQGSVGRALADAFASEFPDRVEEYSFTQPRKAQLAERLGGYVQAKRVSLPKTEQVRTDFLAMQRSASSSGNLIYEGKTRDTHCDYFWAAAMALEAAGEPGLVIV